ncbi:FHA domain-containing protein [Nocardia sp. alder85J]|uniref:FHA domain-containing protein n=1 Tax=Nocardia sp. alder85J TaxID=2862949 RepID=UPI001CD74463|nr:FHA domain-containing protein [Nocardia sp. alder85J]MCX4093264.1 FHA domain-containing protein [Nocardia sp. alder85J]
MSTATDYCDVCGTALAGDRAAVTVVAATAVAPEPARCPSCEAPISGRFCEECGHDSALPAPPQPVGDTMVMAVPDWTGENPVTAAPETVACPEPVAEPEAPATQQVWIATVSADQDFYQRMLTRKGPDAERVEFPGYYPERRIALYGNDFLIGKHSVSQGLLPEIDLGIAPVDIGVSRTHARLHVDETGLTITDLGSTNGTSLNGSDDLIPARIPIPLQPGDRIHVGGWTTITIGLVES